MKLDGSSRQLVALLVASAAAPYLASLLFSLHHLIRHGFANVGEVFEFIVVILVLGTAGLVIYGVPIALTAATLAMLFTWLGVNYWSIAIISGAALGAIFTLFSMPHPLCLKAWVRPLCLSSSPEPSAAGATGGSP
jgi:hypothetical protein